MPSNNIAFARNYTSVIDEVYQRASVSGVLNSGRRMVRASHDAKEAPVPKISVTGLGNYTRNVSYKTGAMSTKPGKFTPPAPRAKCSPQGACAPTRTTRRARRCPGTMRNLTSGSASSCPT